VSDGAITTLLVLSVLIGIGGASYAVFSSPKFWGNVIKEIALKAWPAIQQVLTKRMDPETEKRWRECERRGGKWDHMRKRCDR
jgi:hypothetical protein